MRIPNLIPAKYLGTVGASIGCALALFVQAALAQETPSPTPISAPAAAALPAPSAPNAGAAEQPAGVANNMAEDPTVSQVVGRLKNSTNQPVNLSDMAAAQDLIARLDLLYEVQSKINKLEEQKEDRKKKANAALGLDSLPMPQNVINPLPIPSAAGTASAMPEISEEPELISVQGSGSNLIATVKMGESTIKAGPNNTKLKDYDVLEIKPSYIKIKRQQDKQAKTIYLK